MSCRSMLPLLVAAPKQVASSVGMALCMSLKKAAKHCFEYDMVMRMQHLGFQVGESYRFRRLAGGEDRLSLATLYEQPDLAGNAFVHRIFRLFDTNQDGYLTWEDFSAGIHQICGLQTEDDQSLCKQLVCLLLAHASKLCSAGDSAEYANRNCHHAVQISIAHSHDRTCIVKRIRMCVKLIAAGTQRHSV